MNLDTILNDPVLLAGSVLLGIVVIFVVSQLTSGSETASSTSARDIGSATATTATSSSSKKKNKKKKKTSSVESNTPSSATTTTTTPIETVTDSSAPTTTKTVPTNGKTSKKKKSKGKDKTEEPTKKEEANSNSSSNSKQQTQPVVETKTEPDPVVETPAPATTATTSKKKKKNKTKKTAAVAPAPTPAPAVTTDEDTDDEEEEDLNLLATFAKGGRSPQKKSSNNKNDKKPTTATASEWKTISKKSKASAAGTTEGATSTANTTTEGAAASEEAEAVDPNAPVSETIQIDVTKIPLIIGPKGATIQKIQTDTATKIDVDKTPGAGKATVTGPPTQVLAAVQQIQTILEDSAKQEAHSLTLESTDINGSEGVKAIIGRGGAQIQKIQAACSECRIQANVEQGTVVITGPTPEAVAAAATLCKNAVFGATNATLELGSRAMVMAVCGRNFGDLNQYQKDTQTRMDVSGTRITIRGDTDKVQQAQAVLSQKIALYQGISMELEASKLGAVIGQGGANLRSIQDRTGAQVEVNQVGDSAICKIIGEPKAVQAAQVLVEKSLRGEIELKPGEGRVTVELGVGAPAVIGRGGSTIAELEKKHGVKLNVQDAVCTIVGKKEKLAAAQTAIEGIVKPLIKKAEEEAKIRAQAEALAASGDKTWGLPEDDELAGW